MEMDLIFKIAAIGIVVSVLNVLLNKSGREEYSMMITLAGLIIVLLMMVKEVAELFQTVKTLFRF
jgi:stage III sporulation protein AC